MARFNRMNIGNSAYVHNDITVIDRSYNILVFASCVGYSGVIKVISKELYKNNNVYIENVGYYRVDGNRYNIEKQKEANSDFTHMVLWRKDKITQEQTDQEGILSYIFSKNDEEKMDAIFDKLYEHTSIPILKEWMPYIYAQLLQRYYLNELPIYYDSEKEKPFNCHRLLVKKSQIIEIIQAGLRTNIIKVNNSNAASLEMADITGLDSYLNTYGEILARKIQDSFTPKFIPGESDYDKKLKDFDDVCYHKGIELYKAQKDVMQATVNNLNSQDISLVIGECGSGKTIMAEGIVYAHNKKGSSNSIVMCPSHLTHKWKREIETYIPKSKAYIIKHISDIQNLDKLLRNKNKNVNLFLILSKETAKFDSEYKPNVIWSNTKRTFVCPECGQPLYKIEYEGHGRFKEERHINFSKTDMLKPMAYNDRCMNKKRIWDKKEKKWTEVPCNARLWAPLNKTDETNSNWIKLGADGWILAKHVEDIFNEYISKNDLTKKQTALLRKIAGIKATLDSGQELNLSLKAPRKYPIAKYIKRFYKGYIDYYIVDELHQLKGDTEQGQAFADLACVSKKVIGLTGTLLNGYADGLFYILYRLIPGKMKKEGFEYSDEANFMKAYGVTQRTSRFSVNNGREGNRLNSTEKRLPGISPLVFTKFLLENAAFLSLQDMADGLPSYTETPIAIEMDDELRQNYEELERNIRSACSRWTRGGGMKVMGSSLQTLSTFPDMPYEQPPIINPDTGAIVVTPPSITRGLRNKENRLLELVQERLANQEKVLVYYQWTNRTDVAEKVMNMFRENGINAALMTSSIAAEKREEWIEKKLEEGIDVLVCNPTLVETGLDLLEFTSIIFYQMGYNIYTLRQASRRSWRLSQTNPINVYFLYYTGTIQEQALALMATKLQASMAIEGKFSEEGLRAMSNNEDLLTQIANSVVNGIKDNLDVNVFKHMSTEVTVRRRSSIHYKTKVELERHIKKPTATHNVFLDLIYNKNFLVNLA